MEHHEHVISVPPELKLAAIGSCPRPSAESFGPTLGIGTHPVPLTEGNMPPHRASDVLAAHPCLFFLFQNVPGCFDFRLLDALTTPAVSSFRLFIHCFDTEVIAAPHFECFSFP